MKIRNGFVSNSSSSSFLIYGVNFNPSFDEFTEEGKKLVLEKFPEYSTIENLQEEIEEGNISIGEIIDSMVSYWFPEGSDEPYFGRSWDEVGDDETGKQFKERVKSELKKYFNISDDEFHTFSEAWYS